MCWAGKDMDIRPKEGDVGYIDLLLFPCLVKHFIAIGCL